MAMPSLSQGSGSVIRTSIYITAAVRADPDVAADVSLLQPAHDALLAKATARRDADTAAIGTGAVVDNRASRLYQAAVDLGTATFGHFRRRTDPGYLRLFPEAPSKLRSLSNAERANRYATLARTATAKETPKALNGVVEPFIAAYEAWLSALDADASAELRLADAVRAERGALDAWQTAARRLKGRLTERFPRNTRRVNSYFPKRSRRKRAPRSTAVATPTTSEP